MKVKEAKSESERACDFTDVGEPLEFFFIFLCNPFSSNFQMVWHLTKNLRYISAILRAA